MADEFRMIVDERRVAEDMIRMDMRVDDIAYRHRCDAPDRLPQRPTDCKRSAGVDDRDAPGADDKAEIGDVAEIGAGHLGLLPVMHVDAGRRVFQREIRASPATSRHRLRPATTAQARKNARRHRDGRRGATERRTRCPPIYSFLMKQAFLALSCSSRYDAISLRPSFRSRMTPPRSPAIVMPLATVERSTHAL